MERAWVLEGEPLGMSAVEDQDLKNWVYRGMGNFYENNIIKSQGRRTLRKFGQQWQKLQRSGKIGTEIYLLVLAINVGKCGFYEMVGVETKIWWLEEWLRGEEVKTVSEDAISGILGMKKKRG